MNSGINSIRHALLVVALLAVNNLSAAETGPTRILQTPPAAAASVAAGSSATDAGFPGSARTSNVVALPPLPPGVADLKFSEFFRQPIGPRGFEFTDQLRGLDGKRVRIAGYMVRQSQPVDRCLLLSPVPVTLHEHEYGFAEDMPATILHVFTDSSAPEKIPFTPGLLLLTGTLSLGNRPEADGRVSFVRLQLDAPTPEQRVKLERATSSTFSTNTTPFHASGPEHGHQH
jgi:hypothetical protein